MASKSQLTESNSSGIDNSATDPANGLTFEWQEKRHKQLARIAFYFVLAVVLHAGFFYVFKVVYPSSTQSLPLPARVMLLSEDDPAVRAVLAEVEDRTAAYSPYLGTDVGTVSLRKYTTYQPSFAEHQLELRDPPANVAKRLPLPNALGGAALLPKAESLPAPSIVQPDNHLPPGPRHPALTIGGHLAQRVLEHRPLLDRIFSASSDAVVTFALSVDEAGIVQSCLPDDNLHSDQSEALRRAASQADLKALGRQLYQLRFNSVPGKGNPKDDLTWGFVTVEW
ncbi:MAG: hypothetical protein ACI9R3_004663 [Verrucomicrobiales bacterium]|jgi:hypothetical protein